MKRETVANVIGLVGSIITLAVMWQAVRFCQGSIGAPIIDFFNVIWREAQPNPAEGTTAPLLFPAFGDSLAVAARA